MIKQTKNIVLLIGVLLITRGTLFAHENIIVLIADGAGLSHVTLSRWFKGEALAFDRLSSGICITNSANSLITGSAAAATAIATGYKTWEQDGAVKCIGMLPDSVVYPEPKRLSTDQQWRPVASVLEAARLSGMATGLVATARISHATPAGFSSHWHDRDNDNVIIEQQVYQNIDVVFGGGMRHLLPSGINGGKRTDGENLTKVLKSRGYSLLSKKSELLSLQTSVSKVWGLFSMNHMAADINRPYFGNDEPSLSEMTKVAIEILSNKTKGFFLMVEGSQVDWASHNNDAVGVATEMMAFDKAVEVALEFARKNRNTTVIILPDHDNGGLTIGKRNDVYTDIQFDAVIPVLKKAAITAGGLLDTLIRFSKNNSFDFNTAAKALDQFMDIDKITSEDSIDIIGLVKSVNAGTTGDADVANIGRIVDRRANMGWTTYGHCGTNVWVYGYGVQFNKTIDNTEIAGMCFKKIVTDPEYVNRMLFEDVNVLFKGIRDISIVIDTSGVDNGNGCVTISSTGKTAVIPFFKNEMHFKNGPIVQMNGITVYSKKSGKVFLPAQAQKLFMKM